MHIAWLVIQLFELKGPLVEYTINVVEMQIACPEKCK